MNLPVNRLRDEIGRGVLCLKSDEWTRCRFSFEIDGVLVGCYALRSIGEMSIRAERAWNASDATWDPRKGFFRPQLLARKFLLIRPESQFVIRELMPLTDAPRDIITFRVAGFDLFDGPHKWDASKRCLRFECVDLLGVHFAG